MDREEVLLSSNEQLAHLLSLKIGPETVGEEVVQWIASIEDEDCQFALIEHFLRRTETETANKMSALSKPWKLVFANQLWKAKFDSEDEARAHLDSSILSNLRSWYSRNQNLKDRGTGMNQAKESGLVENAAVSFQEEDTAKGRTTITDDVQTSSLQGPKKADSVKVPRAPSARILKYQDHFYTPYDFVHPNIVVTEPKFYQMSFEIFNDYRLVKGDLPLDKTPLDLPRMGVRLDDRLAGLVWLVFTNQETGRYWPADFDARGTIRAERCPLGSPMLIKVQRGEKDIDGRIAKKAGYYYARQSGLQILSGKEGVSSWMVRPSGEHKYDCLLGFKIADYAVSREDGFGTAITPSQGKKKWSKDEFIAWYNSRRGRSVEIADIADEEED